MMDKPEWLQRFEDPDNMTIKEREKWENEAELRAKMYADAQIFEKFIKHWVQIKCLVLKCQLNTPRRNQKR